MLFRELPVGGYSVVGKTLAFVEDEVDIAFVSGEQTYGKSSGVSGACVGCRLRLRGRSLRDGLLQGALRLRELGSGCRCYIYP